MTSKKYTNVTSLPTSDWVPTRPEPTPEYLTVEEAADILRISRNAAYKAAESGELPGVVRIGRTLRVRRSAL